MILPDVNILIYAHREESVDHSSYRSWLEDAISSEAAFGISDLVLSSFLRIVSNPRIFPAPSPMRRGLAFANAIRERPNAVTIAPGPGHWQIFERLCRTVGVTANLVSDAYLAALAIESGSEWITTDRDFARFPGLRWRHPLDQ